MQPSGDQIFLDHVAHFVADAEAARSALTRAGFLPTPESLQTNAGPGGASVPSGTGNVCVMLEEGYVEILFKTADTKLAREFDEARTRHAGVHLLAFAAADAAKQSARLRVQGFKTRAAVDLRRPVETVLGKEEAGFSVARVEPGEMPEGRIQFLTHRTPDLLWQERWLAHPNGARGLTDAVLAVGDVAEAAARFARFLGRSTTRSIWGESIRLDRGAVHLTSARRLAEFVPLAPPLPFIGLYALRVASLPRIKSLFEAAGLDIRFQGETLVAPFPEALGKGAWIFHEGPGALPWREGT